MLANRSASARHTSGVIAEEYWQFTPGQRVMTVEGIAGTVTAVEDGPFPGAEAYSVALDDDLGGGDYGPGELRPLDGTTAKTATMTTRYTDWGETGNRSHITREDVGTLPISVVADMPGVMGEVPGEHRNKQGQAWETFKADVAANGIKEPIFITVDYGQAPKISEGNHRRDVALELGMTEVPAMVRYFGNAQDLGVLAVSYEPTPESDALLDQASDLISAANDAMAPVESMRSAWKGNLPCPSCHRTNVGEDGEGGQCPDCSGQHTGAYLVEDEVRALGREYLATHPEFAALAEQYEATRPRTAAEDYPELGGILTERPPLQHAVVGSKQAISGGCSACAGTGEQSNGHECYICDGSGDAAAEAEGRALGITNANPENGLPAGIDLAAGLDPTVAGWFMDKVLYPAAERGNKQLDPGHQYQPGTSWSYDWCRFRKNRRCMYPTHMDADATAERGYAVWVPEDRGLCPRDRWDDQKVCPVGEPGEHSGDPNGRPLVAAYGDPIAREVCPECGYNLPHHAFDCPRDRKVFFCPTHAPAGLTPVPFDDGRGRCSVCGEYGGHVKPYRVAAKLAFEFTASWSDVRAKAKRIRTEGGVRVISAPTDVVTSISAEVRGDHGIYQTTILREPGRQSVASWECGCAWSSYSWGRSGRWKRYEGRMCAHALALVYEAQAQGMFGRTIQEQPQTPPWRVDTSIPVQQPTNYPKPRRKRQGSHPVSTAADLQAPPVLEFARAALAEGVQPTAVLHGLVRLGVKDAPDLMAQALKGGPIKAKVRGWVKKIIDILAGGVLVLEDGEHVSASEAFYPTYDPHLGLDLADSVPHVSAKAQGLPKWKYEWTYPDGTKGSMNSTRNYSHALVIQHSEKSAGPMGRTPGEWRPWSHSQDVGRLQAEHTKMRGAPWNDFADSTIVEMDNPRPAEHFVKTEALTVEARGGLNTAQQCNYCKADATKALLWAEGMAYIAACDEHEVTARHKIEVENNDEVIKTTSLPPRESVYKLADADSNGVMVAMRPPDDVCSALSDLGDEDVENMHITLSYLGGVDALSFGEEDLLACVASFAENATTLVGSIAGFGHFTAGPEPVAVALIDCPGLSEFRAALVEHLRACGLVWNENHGFTPHLTLQYGADDVPDEVPQGATGHFTFGEVIVAWGGTWHHLPLAGLGFVTTDDAMQMAAKKKPSKHVHYVRDPHGHLYPYDKPAYDKSQWGPHMHLPLGLVQKVREGEALSDAYLMGGGEKNTQGSPENAASYTAALDPFAFEGSAEDEAMADDSEGRFCPECGADLMGMDPHLPGCSLGPYDHAPDQNPDYDGFGARAELHDEPEPALPITDGDTGDDDDLEESSDFSRLSAGVPTYDDVQAAESSGTTTTASLRPLWLAPTGVSVTPGATSDTSNAEIARAAQAFLKTGMKAFSPAEQAAIIGEGEGITAANLDRLDIAGTHYESLEAALAIEDEDPEGLFI